MIRLLCGIAGACVLLAVAHVTIMSTGGYGDTTAVITLALAGAVIVGAYVAGRSSGPIAFAIIVALLAGEAYGFFATASWHMEHVAKAGAPVRQAMDSYIEAKAWVDRLKSDGRVQRAENALREARKDAQEKSTAKDCKKGCIDTLASTVADATKALSEARQSLQDEQERARAALSKSPRPGAENALADRLGVEAWELDLLMAGLRSFACTVMAGALLAYAAHGTRQKASSQPPKASSSQPEAPSSVKSAPAKVVPIKAGSVVAYLARRTKRDPGASVTLSELLSDYRAECDRSRERPVSTDEFVRTVRKAFDANGLLAKPEGNTVRCLGIKLAS